MYKKGKDVDIQDIYIRDPMTRLIKTLSCDEGYRRTWVANIAMAFMDVHTDVEIQSYDSMMTESLHKRANDAAENFLNLLCRDLDND